MARGKIKILNPVGEMDAKEQTLAPRPKSLHGLKLGLLDNSKHNADHFLNRVSQRLKEEFGLMEIAQKKGNPSLPVPKEAAKALADCNLLITAFGD